MDGHPINEMVIGEYICSTVGVTTSSLVITGIKFRLLWFNGSPLFNEFKTQYPTSATLSIGPFDEGLSNYT